MCFINIRVEIFLVYLLQINSGNTVDSRNNCTHGRRQHPVARQFRDAYRTSPRACAAHAAGASGSPDTCGVCADTCLHDSLICDLGVAAART